MTVENRLFILMAERKIKTLAALADKAGVKYRSLHTFANQEAKFLDPDLIARVCDALECEINDLLVLSKEEVKE